MKPSRAVVSSFKLVSRDPWFVRDTNMFWNSSESCPSRETWVIPNKLFYSIRHYIRLMTLFVSTLHNLFDLKLTFGCDAVHDYRATANFLVYCSVYFCRNFKRCFVSKEILTHIPVNPLMRLFCQRVQVRKNSTRINLQLRRKLEIRMGEWT